MQLRESKYGPFYGCSGWPECSGTHGAHPDGSPLGIPADKATREARIRAHRAFDLLWRRGSTSGRRRAYRALMRLMGISKAGAHIGRFTMEQCETLIERLEKEGIHAVQV